MDALKMITDRRSIRKFKDEIVSEDVLREIVEVAKFAPSWANFQIARYNFITDPKIISQIAESGLNGFLYNKTTLENAKNLLVLSFVEGKSGKLGDKADNPEEKSFEWEFFDAGIACQTFCLTAHAKGVGTCIFGVIDKAVITKLIDLPENEKIGAVIVYGYPDEVVEPTKRKDIEKIARFK